MKNQMLHYDREHDILSSVIREGVEYHFVEITEGIVVEFDQAN